MPIGNKEDLFKEQLGETLDAENQFLEGMRQMAEKSSNQELKSGLQEHIEQTEQQVKNIEKAFKAMDAEPETVECEEARAIAKEYARQVKNLEGEDLIDIETATSSIKAEHFEIGNYQGLVTSAEKIGNEEVQDLLQQNLQQEEEMAKRVQSLYREMP